MKSRRVVSQSKKEATRIVSQNVERNKAQLCFSRTCANPLKNNTLFMYACTLFFNNDFQIRSATLHWIFPYPLKIYFASNLASIGFNSPDFSWIRIISPETCSYVSYGRHKLRAIAMPIPQTHYDKTPIENIYSSRLQGLVSQGINLDFISCRGFFTFLAMVELFTSSFKVRLRLCFSLVTSSLAENNQIDKDFGTCWVAGIKM